MVGFVTGRLARFATRQLVEGRAVEEGIVEEVDGPIEVIEAIGVIEVIEVKIHGDRWIHLGLNRH